MRDEYELSYGPKVNRLLRRYRNEDERTNEKFNYSS